MLPTSAGPDQLATTSTPRRLPIGAELIDANQVHFRVWAPACGLVDVVIGSRETSLAAEEGGYFSGVARASAGERYGFRLDRGDRVFPDPASRFQPDGPHRLSEIVDPKAFAWTDSDWQGVRLEGQVIYELHIGTFTKEGTWTAATRELPELADAGITVIEVMPISEFDGRFGWGYDGVDLFAPFHGYGSPDDVRRFVDRAHAVGVGVILDVVYNHLGPSGNYLGAYSRAYVSDRYENEWGDALNFDGPESGPVREFFRANAAYWIDEFHMDGLRLDATQQIYDRSDDNIMAVIGRTVRGTAGSRSTIIVAENEPQDARLVRPATDGGYGLDALWNDDFHHSAMVALTGRGEAYYSDTQGGPQELVSAAKYGYLFQGQFYSWQHQNRGTAALDVPAQRFVVFLQNHDQVANSAAGLRGDQLTSPGRWRAMTALFLLGPSTPLLFQGQEFSASTPFYYFADFEPGLAAAVRQGRSEFLSQFPSVVGFQQSRGLVDPGDPETYERCKLDLSERAAHAESYTLHKDLLRLRRAIVARATKRHPSVDGAVLGGSAFVLRLFGVEPRDDRLLLVNLGGQLHQRSFAEPLLAPPAACEWSVAWSSDDPRYGGPGIRELWIEGQWWLPGESAQLLAASPAQPRPSATIRRRSA
jgi:maltooligosyltrehalose trehalohydrolase